ncbi:MAG: hypothetical protein ACFE8E_03100 [Candidatus Hodarchaeota archaeon]
MKLDVISRKYGWYLAKVTASIESFKNIVATSLETIKKYNLQPGRYIKISSLIQTNSDQRFENKFILLPYFKELIRNYLLLHDVIKSLTNTTFRYVDKEYITEIIKLMSKFYQSKNDIRTLKVSELLEFDDKHEFQMKIAVPESWLNDNNVDLGEIVLLRNNIPSPVIF